MDIELFAQLLQSDLAGELTAISHYVTYAATVRGLNRPELKEMFEEEAGDELRHAQFFADKIAKFGFFPEIMATPATEAETTQIMISNLLALEEKTVKNYSQRADQAMQMGLHALAIDIENILTDELTHRDELAMMLNA